jgi:AcrR family transcriptional regulator
MGWREEKKNKFRECILEHAFVQFSKLGYEKTNLSDISRLCGIAEGTLYNYFEDKSTLFVATFTQQTQKKLSDLRINQPKTSDMLIEEFIRILEFFMKIDDPGLEDAFKTYYHLLKSQNSSERIIMSRPLQEADEFIYHALNQLLSSVTFKNISCEKMLEIIEKQFDGLLNDYIYNGDSFSRLMSRTKEHLTYIIAPFIQGFKES